MCDQIHCRWHSFAILVVICGLTRAQMPPPMVARPNPCVKFDFNSPPNLFAPNFIIKPFSTNPMPFRPTYHSYLTNKAPGFSFAQPATVLTFNQTTSIEALVYFQPVGAAYFDISIRDVKTNAVTQILHITTFTSWQTVIKYVPKVITEGRVSDCVLCTILNLCISFYC